MRICKNCKYRKKPVVIEAIQWTGNNWNEIFSFIGDVFKSQNNMDGTIEINTLEGNMVANIGDWIIKGVKGEFYPCKPDIFEQTYEKVEPEEARGAEKC